MKETATRGWFWFWGKWMYKLRLGIAAIWLAAFVVLGLFAQMTPELLKDNGFTPRGSESDQGFVNLQRQLDFPASSLSIVYTSDKLDLTEAANQATIYASLEEVKQLAYVVSVEPQAAKRLADGSYLTAITVPLKLDTDTALEQYPHIRSLIQPPADMNVYVTGGTAILYDMQAASKHDIAQSEIVGLPIALVVLVLVFGTALGALLPLIVGVMSVTVTLGLTYFIAQTQSLSNFLPNMVTMLGLAVGIDYALFTVSRFREELKRSASVEEAVAVTSQTAGKSIFFSGLAVLIGLFGMMFVDLSIYRSLCIGGVIVVLVSVLVANTLLLSLLGLFGRRIDRLRLVPRRMLAGASGGRLWERIAYGVMKRPVTLIVAVAALLVVCMLPLGGMRLGLPNAEVLPPSYESRYGSDLLDREFDPADSFPIQVFVQTKEEIWSAASIREMAAYTARIAADPGVKEVKSYLTGLGTDDPEQAAALLAAGERRQQLKQLHLASGHAAFIAVTAKSGPDSRDSERLVDRLRTMERGQLETQVSGATAYRVDILQRISAGIPYVVGFVMLVTYAVLFVAFRSALLPLKAVLMNMLSLGASLGMVVLVFQHGWLAEALHITSTGYVSATLPIIIFCVVFGISMDYEVFLISRIAEEYDKHGDNEASTAAGLTRTGSLITSAAFILIAVVGSFIFTDIEIIKALGLGLALAVLIDATLVRIVMVPALMKVLGKANWWAPGWLRRHGQ
ncbi:MMPL family transporter [Paenibacillus cymbidii]|uniref:MMPL family transporter n=1 Tax=Paenibacillus cymbidii TaxID=1639034 RepID=UPI001F3CEAF3|nr:MMPL family transporter [Paenibacillus cymbidii]